MGALEGASWAVELASAAWIDGWTDGWTPDPLLTVSEWADQHRKLAQKAASEPGQWRTSRTPYLREIMDCLSDQHPAQEVIFMASIQVGKSEVGLNWTGYTIDATPSSMLAVLPTVEVGERWSKQRLAPMISQAPALSAKIAPARSRDSGNTTLLKEFGGDDGILIIGGANSAASLSSMPIKKLLLDEVDRYPQEIEEEGDPVDIAEGRTQNFPRRKILKVSSPTIESLSRINKDWKRSDQRHYYVPCPDCGTKQVLKWDCLNWPEGKPDEVRYVCEHCGVLIEEHRKTWMLEQGEWRATFPERTVVGFHINGLYSPLGLGRTWAQHAKRHEEVRHDPVRLKVFVNQVLGECYEDPDERLDWEELKSRAEPYRLREIPEGCLVLDAGVDVQKDRLEVQVAGWGRGEQCWLGIDWHQIAGDPLRPAVWLELDEYLARPFVNRYGVSMRIVSAAVDSGYLQDDVLNYTRLRKNRGIFATKGASQRGRQIIGRPSKVDFTWQGAVIKEGGEQWQVGADSGKTRLFQRLSSDRKQGHASSRLVHFGAGLPDEYFMQLTAEIYDPNKAKWVKLHNRRNEALDTAVLCMAAAMHPRLRVHVARDHDWDKIEALVQPKGVDLFAMQAINNEGAVAEPTPRADGTDAAPPNESRPAQPAIATQPASSGLFNSGRRVRSRGIG